MIYSKKYRHRQQRNESRGSILAGMPMCRVLPSRSFLLAIALIAAMGTLLNIHYKTDLNNCPCLSLTRRELAERSAGGYEQNLFQIDSKDMQPSSKPHKSQKVTKDIQPSKPSSINNMQSPLPSDKDTQSHLKFPNKAIVSLPRSPTANITPTHFNKNVQKTNVVPNKFKPDWWKNHTRTVCKLLGMSTDQRSLQPDMLSKVLVDDNHKILFCQIAKVASTNLGKIFAIIAGKFNGTNPDAIDSIDIHYKFNKLQVHLDAFPVDVVLKKLETYYKFVFVRDPFERILSGYRNKFLKTATSYFTYLNNKLVAKYRTNITQTGGVTFPEFVSYLVDEERKVPMNGHWQPMHELCRPCETNYDFIGNMNSLGEDISYIIEVNNLNGIVTVPKQTHIHSFHKTDLYLKEFFSQVPKPLLLKLFKMYNPDYAIFNFEVPNVILKMFK